MKIPPYVYDNNLAETYNFKQGDILKVDGEFRRLFCEFYPVINHHEDNQCKYAMVLSQTCDLVKNEKRKPKIEHITLCLVRSFSNYLDRYINKTLKISEFSENKILDKVDYNRLQSKIHKLLNNSESKTHFYLPKHSPFTEDMVAILTLPYPFRIEHYDILYQNKVLSLTDMFQAKIGDMLANLYGRVATPDLLEKNSMADIDKYIESLMRNLSIKQVPDKSYIQFLKKNGNQNNTLEELMTIHQAKIRQENFKPERMALMKKLREKLFEIFSDNHLCDNLVKMDKQNLRKEISHILTGN